MSCKTSKAFKDYIIGAPAEVRMNILLDPLTDYVWELTDGFGNMYHSDFTTDSEGIGALDMEDLPDGFANVAQAPLQIRVKTSAEDCDYVPLVIAQRFLQVEMDFRSGTAVKDWIACAITAPAPSEGLTEFSSEFSNEFQ